MLRVLRPLLWISLGVFGTLAVMIAPNLCPARIAATAPQWVPIAPEDLPEWAKKIDRDRLESQTSRPGPDDIAQLFPSPPNTTVRPQDPSPAIKPDGAPCTKRCILPPKEFDRPYSGELIVVTAHSQDELKEFCGTAYRPGLTLGCARPGNTSCRIVMAPEQIIIAGGWTKALMLRHEIGHCNGWGGDHAGQRSSNADEIEAKSNVIQPVWKVWPR